MTAAQIIDAVIAQCGTDASRATVLSMLNEQYATQVADSRWMRVTANIAPTTIGQSQYAVPPNVVEAYALRIGGLAYYPIGDDALWNVRHGRASLTYGQGGVFSQTYDTLGALLVDVQPIPEVNSIPIYLAAAVVPAALTDGSNQPATPVDTHGHLIDATAALVLDRIDERPDLAAPKTAKFEARIETLRRRRNSQLNGSGPIRMLVSGVHF